MVFFVLTRNKGTEAMHVKRFSHKLLTPVIHKARVKVLSEVVTAAIYTKELKLTALGRGIDTGIQERSGIQKVNRLLGNESLLAERVTIFEAITSLLIGHAKRPEILVDWTKQYRCCFTCSLKCGKLSSDYL
jgi:hypothetical protein